LFEGPGLRSSSAFWALKLAAEQHAEDNGESHHFGGNQFFGQQ
jgi:hypothetical protein